jgi:hypothetical protein
VGSKRQAHLLVGGWIGRCWAGFGVRAAGRGRDRDGASRKPGSERRDGGRDAVARCEVGARSGACLAVASWQVSVRMARGARVSALLTLEEAAEGRALVRPIADGDEPIPRSGARWNLRDDASASNGQGVWRTWRLGRSNTTWPSSAVCSQSAR